METVGYDGKVENEDGGRLRLMDSVLSERAGGELEDGGEKKCECVFCGITSGRRECAVVYSNDYVMAICDRQPVAEGHCLVLLRNHRTTMNDVSRGEKVEMGWHVDISYMD